MVRKKTLAQPRLEDFSGALEALQSVAVRLNEDFALLTQDLSQPASLSPQPIASATREIADPIYITRPYLPPLAEFLPLLETIWSSRILTNNGPIHNRLERELETYLGVENVALVANGTQALSVALQVLNLSGEVITTPYSFVATSHALCLASLTPVFADIRAEDFNIDPQRIEDAITPKTVALMPVHCYGNPCDLAAIEDIARRRNLRVIYDGAHAFGVKKDGETILDKGDFTTLSFHATKAFNTFEGGAIIAPSPEAKLKINRMKNFGFRDEVTVESIGGNAKMSELNAALGILQLKHHSEVLRARQRVDARYRKLLSNVEGVVCPSALRDVQPNYSYFPVRVTPSFPISRDALYERLKAANIFARRYFYPLLTHFPMYADLPSAQEVNLPVANLAASEILCLPLFPEMSAQDQDRIVDVISAVR